jgi:hypothetical protein
VAQATPLAQIFANEGGPWRWFGHPTGQREKKKYEEEEDRKDKMLRVWLLGVAEPSPSQTEVV